jgi:hypothetical protein
MSGYRDPSVSTGSSDVWGDEPGDVFASETLPGPARHDETTGYLDTHYGPMGGKRIQDQTDSFDHKDFPQGNVVTSSIRVATNHELVRDLVKDFIKDHGKKDITKRHIVAFLKAKGSYAFLSSDMIRCLNLEHNAKVMDVLDVFPVKVASVKPGDLDSSAVRVASIREALVASLQDSSTPTSTVNEYHRIAADLALALAAYERIYHHGQ